MNRKSLFLLTSSIIFSVLLIVAILPPVFAGDDHCGQQTNCRNGNNSGHNDNRPNISHNISARTGNNNHFGSSNSHASVNNDNSVHINQNNGGGGHPQIDRNKNGHNNNHKNNNKKDNDKDKKVVKKDIDKDITKTVENVVIHVTPPPVVPPAPQVVVVEQPVVNENVNRNENVNVNENIHTVETVRYEDKVVYVDNPVVVKEVAAEHVVYPVQPVTTTPATGVEHIALLSLPTMAGAGLYLRRRFLV